MDSSRLQPAFYGGLFIGVLSALPVVQIGNCCCCLWVLSGGVLAVYLRQQNTAVQVQASEGAIVGLLAGLIGGVIGGILGLLLQPVTTGIQRGLLDRVMANNPDMPSELRDMLQQMSSRAAAGGAVAAQIGFMFVGIIVDGVFGLLGGLLGVAIFKKNAPPPPPPGTIDVVPLPPPPPPAPPPVS